MKTADKTNDLIHILRKQNIESLFFIDVGAKDQLDFLAETAPITDIIGFEPNPAELELLRKRYSDANFKSIELIGKCLSDFDGDVSFNVAKRPSMSSLLKTDTANYRKHFGLYKEFENWKSNIETEQVIKASAAKLDTFIKDKNAVIDYLKIDTQGSELTILRGAEQLLNEKRINILKVEASTIAVYQDQVLFSDIDIYLRSKGYTLVDFITYKENYIPVSKNRHDKNPHSSPCGDAIYVLDSRFLTNAGKIKSGLLLLWLGYYSLGTFLIADSGLSPNDQKILTAHNFTPFRKKLKQLAVNLCPPIVWHWLKKIR